MACLLPAGCAPPAAPSAGVPPPAHPLGVAWGYPAAPFRLSAAETARLRAENRTSLYVSAGELGMVQGRPAWLWVQQWPAKPPCPLRAVVRVRADAAAALLQPGGARQAAVLTETLPASVTGIQWELPVAAEQLPACTAFLNAFRTAQRRQRLLGVAVRPEWEKSPGFPALCTAAEEIALRFYEEEAVGTRDEPARYWDTRDLLRRIGKASEGTAQVQVGLPVSPRAVVWGPDGQRVGIEFGLDPGPFAAHPVWLPERSETRTLAFTPFSGPVPAEDLFAARAVRSTRLGRLGVSAGSRVVFQWTRAHARNALRREVEKREMARVEGLLYFRWPPPPAGQPSVPLALEFRSVPTGVQLTVRNPGEDSPLLGPGVALELDPGGGSLVSPGGAAARSVTDRPGRIYLRHPFLLPSTPWYVGELHGATRPVQARLTWRDGTGMRRRAEAAWTPGR
ncbi:MAG: hypothetical protein FJX77_00585 [Armatimonadetes bacterium]|nr:hypothetical protein [Armatimonadota bacterium]